MVPRIALLLGRTVWTRDGGEWLHESLEAGADLASSAVDRLAALLSHSTTGRTIIVFEPEGMAHQLVETPKVTRRVFASLERVRNDHPVVASENLGWGIEYPEPSPAGELVTQMHSELTPGLIHVRDSCERAESRLIAAWSAFTAGAACLRSRPVPKARFVLILTSGFSAVISCGGGKRSFRSWVGPMLDRDWKAFSIQIGDFEANPSPSMTDGELRRGTIVVVTEGDPKNICPIWGDLYRSGRVERVMDMEAFASNAASIPIRHPANLVDAFPRPLELDRYLGSIALAGLFSAVTLSAVTINSLRNYTAEEGLERVNIRTLQGRNEELSRNKREMAHLRDQCPDGPLSTAGGHQALVGLASAVPDPLTLTSVTIGRDGQFELKAMVVGSGFNPEDTRQAFVRYGFLPRASDGWSLDAASGTLVVRGNYKGSQQ